METATIWAKRSTCFRAAVGAVLVWNNNPVSIGYNGAPAGEEHCDGNNCYHSERGCQRAQHAEYNAINRWKVPVTSITTFSSTKPPQWSTAKQGDPLTTVERRPMTPRELTMYCTHSPCLLCAELIVSRGIARFFFREYYRDVKPLGILDQAGVECYRLQPSGYITDVVGNIVEVE